MIANTSRGAGRHVCIVGAGIIGCATAMALSRDGWRVTLVDAQATPGQGETRANGAQLSYSYVEPLATPAALRALPGWLLSADSPLRWRPRNDWAHWRWLAAFVASCRWPQVRRTTDALLSLSALSRDTLQSWLDTVPGLAAGTLHARPGKLVLYRDAAARPSVQRQLGWQREMGCVQRVVEADECRALEPALAVTGGGDIAFGVWTDSEAVVDAALLAQALARASGAMMRLGDTALRFEQRDGRVHALQLSSTQRIDADAFVLAAGPAARALLQALGWAPLVEPIKGYSITLPVLEPNAAPRVSVTDQGRKLVYARLGEQLRVAGFAELCGTDRSLDPRRIDALCKAVRETFPGACGFDDPKPWVGLRPATPGGRPLIGATRWPGLWLNAGHGALGLTLAGGSAALLSSLMGGQAPAIDPLPYRLPA
ncbi:FAD-dependent oxidoreductase [Aquabacterium sp.]|uniref:FAD-dependent oxidoreductase n=1 Tax=Aquabacterium sp. TaxID=1872578 RepID=UPI002CE7B2DD|nr:FAD-dependent oxidoreductase [Aquabacterium sp.]HSW03132.1 FAD-dependent oxidoreductase [Aquabacterium sp.]